MIGGDNMEFYDDVSLENENSNIPVYIIDFTEEEILAREKNVEAFDIQMQDMESKELAKQSGLEKLKKLGLTEEEAKAVIGI